MMIPMLTFQQARECHLKILGGTFVGMAPTAFPVKHVLLPVLAQMGAHVEVDVVKGGYFPDVVGRLDARIKSLGPGETLSPIKLLERSGDLQSVELHV
jgi:RNA 3'-terminal phosphate cyclase